MNTQHKIIKIIHGDLIRIYIYVYISRDILRQYIFMCHSTESENILLFRIYFTSINSVYVFRFSLDSTVATFFMYLYIPTIYMYACFWTMKVRENASKRIPPKENIRKSRYHPDGIFPIPARARTHAHTYAAFYLFSVYKR